MVSTESLRRFPLFAGLNNDQVAILSEIAYEETAEPGHYFFREKDDLKRFYILLEGQVSIVIGVPDRDVEQTFTMQITRNLVNKDLTVTTVGEGEMFGWSALVPPHTSTAGAKANTYCKVLAFDAEKLQQIFQEDWRFGYMMIQRAAQVIRQRLRDRRVEALAFTPA